jgi:hypothetical protein
MDAIAAGFLGEVENEEHGCTETYQQQKQKSTLSGAPWPVDRALQTTTICVYVTGVTSGRSRLAGVPGVAEVAGVAIGPMIILLFGIGKHTASRSVLLRSSTDRLKNFKKVAKKSK